MFDPHFWVFGEIKWVILGHAAEMWRAAEALTMYHKNAFSKTVHGGAWSESNALNSTIWGCEFSKLRLAYFKIDYIILYVLLLFENIETADKYVADPSFAFLSCISDCCVPIYHVHKLCRRDLDKRAMRDLRKKLSGKLRNKRIVLFALNFFYSVMFPGCENENWQLKIQVSGVNSR